MHARRLAAGKAGMIAIVGTGILASLWTAPVRAESRINKLLYMYHFYYLPFSIDFRVGRTESDILPFLPGKRDGGGRMVTNAEWSALEIEHRRLREGWESRSLLLSTPVPLGESKRITGRIFAHHISASRTACESVPLPDRIQFSKLLQEKSPEVQGRFRQLQFLKSFLRPDDDNSFHFFIVSASWCPSCRDYRMLLETYFKDFPPDRAKLHSLLVDDPSRTIFTSPAMRDLFPHGPSAAKTSVPRFLAIENADGLPVVHEDGDALFHLYERFFKKVRGFADSRLPLLRGRATSSK
jgi:hypothetical protein